MSGGFTTLFYKEVLRFYKVILQTIVAPAITTLLYLLVFSHALEEHVRVFGDVAYTVFLVPGLVMMTVIQNAFANSSSSLIQSKITGNIVFVLLTPLSYVEFYLAFLLAAVTRGLVVGLAVYLCAAPFVALPLHSAWLILAFAMLGSAVLGTLGVIAGIWAEKFDQLAAITNFIITPLSFLSGTFYLIDNLPEPFRSLSHLNPYFYLIDGFRYGFIGRADGRLLTGIVVTGVLSAALCFACREVIASGYRLKS